MNVFTHEMKVGSVMGHFARSPEKDSDNRG